MIRSLPVMLAMLLTGPLILSNSAGYVATTSSDAGRCVDNDDMVRIPAGVVLLGEDGRDAPGRRTFVPAFRIDRHEVTNRQFAAFVAATRYRTVAERAGGGAVFIAPIEIDGTGPAQWWKFVEGANWRHPRGPDSDIDKVMEAPVVQIAWEDAEAYARWNGTTLPSREQWERAARATQSDTQPQSSWAYSPTGHPIANTWQGIFPVKDVKEDGFSGLAPVGCFPPNSFGLVDMIGNAWEWTSEKSAPGTQIVRGGSFLCSINYCANFRPAGWQAQETDFPTSHIGFRTVDVPEQQPS